MFGRQVEVLLDAVDHAAAACVYAEVVDATLKVRDVWVDLAELKQEDKIANND